MNNLKMDKKINLFYLTENYIPKKILFREEQIQNITKAIESFKNYGDGTCLLITGLTGSGKSVVFNKLKEKYKKEVEYVDATVCKRSSDILNAFSEENHKTITSRLQKLINQIRSNPKCLIIDEVDKIKDLNELFNILNAIHRTTLASIILATKNINFFKNLPDDFRVFFKQVRFSPYNAIELHEILNERLFLMNYQLPEGKGALISAIASGQGSARLLMQVIKECIMENNFENEFIKKKVKEFEENENKDYITNNLNNSSTLIIKELLNLKEDKIPMTSQELKQRLNISKSTISKTLDFLEVQMELIESEQINTGKKGQKTRLIKIGDDELKLLSSIVYPN